MKWEKIKKNNPTTMNDFVHFCAVRYCFFCEKRQVKKTRGIRGMSVHRKLRGIQPMATGIGMESSENSSRRLAKRLALFSPTTSGKVIIPALRSP